MCCSGARPRNAAGRDAATLFSPRGWGSREPCGRKGWQKLGWRKGEPWRPDIQNESRGPKPVSTPLHLQAVQRANRESKPGHPHPRDKSLLGREHSSQAWLQDPTGQIFIKSKWVGEGSKAFPFVMNNSRCLLSSVFGHTEVIS